jgi:hypothetical protein
MVSKHVTVAPQTAPSLPSVLSRNARWQVCVNLDWVFASLAGCAWPVVLVFWAFSGLRMVPYAKEANTQSKLKALGAAVTAPNQLCMLGARIPSNRRTISRTAWLISWRARRKRAKTDHLEKSGRGLPHSITWRTFQQPSPSRQRRGVLQPSGAFAFPMTLPVPGTSWRSAQQTCDCSLY